MMQGDDKLTGGNGTHNAEADYLAREVEKTLTKEGIEIPYAKIKERVHKELAALKDNSGYRRNGNVRKEDLAGVVETVADIFRIGAGKRAYQGILKAADEAASFAEGVDVVVEEAVSNAIKDVPIGTPHREQLAAQLRTQLHADWKGYLSGQWYIDDISQVSASFRQMVLDGFVPQAYSTALEAVAAAAN